MRSLPSLIIRLVSAFTLAFTLAWARRFFSTWPESWLTRALVWATCCFTVARSLRMFTLNSVWAAAILRADSALADAMLRTVEAKRRSLRAEKAFREASMREVEDLSAMSAWARSRAIRARALRN